MSFLAASIASSSSATSSSNQSLVFNPVITVGSPEAQIRQDSRADQRSTFSADTSSVARASSTITPFGEGSSSGYEPSATLGKTSPSQGSGPSFLAGDLIPGNAGAFASSPEGLALMAGLAVAVYFVAKRFF